MGLEERLPAASCCRRWRRWPATSQGIAVAATFGLHAAPSKMMATAGPRFDIARFGMERFSATPRQRPI